eukprot:GILJ01010440.1.p1 GENE.GILJ01010440.1~~GILJ01010440.1.p1  ORF type:complete len:634 (-),score=99.46 GILJ01010440.1:270-1991(-)
MQDRTALRLASRLGHTSVVETLIVAGADLESINASGSALIEAAHANQLAVVKSLITAGANVNYVAEANGTTALIEAAERGNLDMVQCLVRANADVNVMRKNGATALHMSAQRSSEVAEFLLESGARWDVVQQGCSTLEHAAAAGFSKVVRQLVEKSRKDILEEDGVPAFMAASRHGRVDIVTYLVEEGVDVDAVLLGQTALTLAASSGKLHIVRLLISLGVDVNKRVEEQTALAYAYRARFYDVCKALIEAGADVHHAVRAVGSWGPFEHACETGHHNFIQTLLDTKFYVLSSSSLTRSFSDMDFTNCIFLTEHYETPLHKASANGHVDVIRALLNAGDKTINWPEPTRRCTPLILAASRNHLRAVQCLAAVGHADVERTDRWDYSALAWAAKLGYTKIVTFLVGVGASFNKPVEDGSTPLILAAVNGQAEVVEFLMSAGADIHAKKMNGKTAFDEAFSRPEVAGCNEVVRILSGSPKKLSIDEFPGCLAAAADLALVPPTFSNGSVDKEEVNNDKKLSYSANMNDVTVISETTTTTRVLHTEERRSDHDVSAAVFIEQFVERSSVNLKLEVT